MRRIDDEANLGPPAGRVELRCECGRGWGQGILVVPQHSPPLIALRVPCLECCARNQGRDTPTQFASTQFTPTQVIPREIVSNSPPVVENHGGYLVYVPPPQLPGRRLRLPREHWGFSLAPDAKGRDGSWRSEVSPESRVTLQRNGTLAALRGLGLTVVETEEDRQVVNSLRKIVQGGRFSLLIQGEAGTGKSHLLYACAQDLCLDGADVEVLDERLYQKRIRSSWNGTEEDRRERQEELAAQTNRYVHVDVLVWDELAAGITDERLPTGIVTELDVLLRERTRLGRATLWATNCRDEGLKARLGYPVFSRILGAVGENSWQLRGLDRRITGNRLTNVLQMHKLTEEP